MLDFESSLRLGSTFVFFTGYGGGGGYSGGGGYDRGGGKEDLTTDGSSCFSI